MLEAEAQIQLWDANTLACYHRRDVCEVVVLEPVSSRWQMCRVAVHLTLASFLIYPGAHFNAIFRYE